MNCVYKKFAVACALLYSASVLCIDSHKQQLAELCAYRGPRLFLLSYPRSGNTWLRYCLEFLTRRPSLSKAGLYYAMQQPLGWSAGFELDMQKGPIEKVHARHEIMPRNAATAVDMHVDKLIFIVRNPKETIARFEHATFEQLLASNIAGKGYRAKLYFDNFTVFLDWPENNRLLVYYEDLMQHPRKTLEKILLFLGEPFVHMDEFIKDYAKHQKLSKKIYKDTVHGSNDVLYHSKKLSQSFKQQVDIWISQVYPELWKVYLQRYSE